jgi:hypothetical protein
MRLRSDYVDTISQKHYYNGINMTPEEKARKIKEIYDKAKKKLKELEEKRKKVVRNYIKELEAQKIDAIRTSILKDK